MISQWDYVRNYIGGIEEGASAAKGNVWAARVCFASQDYT